jgi:hypothetical protein
MGKPVYRRPADIIELTNKAAQTKPARHSAGRK